jgi:hypothetical protein
MTPAPNKPRVHFVIRYARHAVLGALFVVAATAGIVSGCLPRLRSPGSFQAR